MLDQISFMVGKAPSPIHTTSGSSKEEDNKNRSTQKTFSGLGPSPAGEPSGPVLFVLRNQPSSVAICSSATVSRSNSQAVDRLQACGVKSNGCNVCHPLQEIDHNATKVLDITTTITITTTKGAWKTMCKGGGGRFTAPTEHYPLLSQNTSSALTEDLQESAGERRSLDRCTGSVQPTHLGVLDLQA